MWFTIDRAIKVIAAFSCARLLAMDAPIPIDAPVYSWAFSVRICRKTDLELTKSTCLPWRDMFAISSMSRPEGYSTLKICLRVCFLASEFDAVDYQANNGEIRSPPRRHYPLPHYKFEMNMAWYVEALILFASSEAWKYPNKSNINSCILNNYLKDRHHPGCPWHVCTSSSPIILKPCTHYSWLYGA